MNAKDWLRSIFSRRTYREPGSERVRGRKNESKSFNALLKWYAMNHPNVVHYLRISHRKTIHANQPLILCTFDALNTDYAHHFWMVLSIASLNFCLFRTHTRSRLLYSIVRLLFFFGFFWLACDFPISPHFSWHSQMW